MTIINMWVSRTQALLGTDTKAISPSGDAIQVSKMLPLAHANLVIGHSGNLVVANTVFMFAQVSRIDDIDALDKMFPLLIEHVFQRVNKASAGGASGAEGLGKQIFVAVGYSPKCQQMIGLVYNYHGEGQPLERIQLGGDEQEWHDWLFGWEESFEAPVPNSHTAMAEVARIQFNRIIDKFPETRPAGGRLLVAELTRERIAITTACTLD